MINNIKGINESFFPLIEKIDTLLKCGKAIIGIDGGSGSGKTTLASLLCEIYDATVFHMDDFFLTPSMRTNERLSEVGGNVDRERFENEVLIPLKQGTDVNYRRFDCKASILSTPVSVKPKNLVIIEGSYSLHPDLIKYYDFSVFLDIDVEKQRERIKKRNGEGAKAFFEKWIPLENTYFEKTQIKDRCDMIIKIYQLP
jgi:uridine kinase